MTRPSETPHPSRTVALGRWLFRYRSLTPLPLILAVAGWLLWDRPGVSSIDPGPKPPAYLELSWLALALLVAGETLRLAVVGRAPAGTSGRGRRLEARVLVTWGPYAWTRNPLYLGNLLLCLGLVVEVGSLVVGLGALLFFYLQYKPVIEAEEAYLRERFGQAYDGWCAHTPRFWPRVWPGSWSQFGSRFRLQSWSRSSETGVPASTVGPIRWGTALIQDADTWFAAFGGRALWRWWLERPPLSGLGTAGSGFLALAGVYLGVKSVKKLRKRRKAGV